MTRALGIALQVGGVVGLWNGTRALFGSAVPSLLGVDSVSCLVHYSIAILMLTAGALRLAAATDSSSFPAFLIGLVSLWRHGYQFKMEIDAVQDVSLKGFWYSENFYDLLWQGVAVAWLVYALFTTLKYHHEEMAPEFSFMQGSNSLAFLLNNLFFGYVGFSILANSGFANEWATSVFGLEFGSAADRWEFGNFLIMIGVYNLAAYIQGQSNKLGLVVGIARLAFILYYAVVLFEFVGKLRALDTLTDSVADATKIVFGVHAGLGVFFVATFFLVF